MFNDEEDPEKKYRIELYSYLILHQITHILGFHKEVLMKFNKFIFKNETITRINSKGIIKPTIRCKSSECKFM